MKGGEEERQARGRGGGGNRGEEEEELVEERGREDKESRQRGRGAAEMKSACSHLCFVNRWVEVSDCEERQSGADTSI